MIVLSGGTSFIGQALKRHLLALGHTVSCPSREDLDLRFDPNENIFRGADSFFHLAYDFHPSGLEPNRRVNVEGSLRLFQAARKAGVRQLIHISSLSAFPGCPSIYGKTKLHIEELCPDVLHVRPGLVYGNGVGGVYGALEKLVSRLKVVPIIGRGDQIQYLVHVEDLCLALGQILKLSDLSSPISIAHPQPVKFREIIAVMARLRNKHVSVFPVPYAVVRSSLLAVEALGIKMRLRSDSLLGLQQANPHPDFNNPIVNSGLCRNFLE